DANNALAHAYYAEILTDTQRWAQAGDEAQLALSLNPNSMDVQRANGYYLENVGSYEEAIAAYQAAATINPNLGFLYMRLGLNYRVLQDYETALEYFARASALNPDEVLPYLSISRTYFQVGEYGRSAQYLESALELAPDDPDIYGRLGLVYFKALNYEGAEIELECAVKGCVHPERGTTVEPLSLSQSTLEYFYTYASVKAAYLKCDEAVPVMNQVSAFASDNEIVQGIVEENRAICATAGAPVGQPAPEGTADVVQNPAVEGTPQSATAAPAAAATSTP
ncbi:MAG: tetratricopeptide repeat protein, partial [Anaerolineales bacterium]